MKKITAISAFALVSVILAFAAYAGSGKQVEEKKGAWKKIVWVDENGTKHVTLVNSADYDRAETKASDPSGAALPRIINAKVVKVDDLETAQLEDGRIIRYIGVKSPEKSDPGYEEALRFHRDMVEGKWVNILHGPKAYADDGSIWSFVFINKLTFVNAELIRFGHVRVQHIEPNTEYRVLFDHLQDRARKRKLGIWRE